MLIYLYSAESATTICALSIQPLLDAIEMARKAEFSKPRNITQNDVELVCSRKGQEEEGNQR